MKVWFISLILCMHVYLYSIPHYYCTAANEKYYRYLLNLIGSIHRHDFEELEEIAVYDLGLTQNQRVMIEGIAKVRLYTIQNPNPHLLKVFYYPVQQSSLGWFAWKPVVIGEVLEKFPYVLWLDAGVTVQKPLDHLFSYIEREGYFLSLIGDSYRIENGVSHPNHSIAWGSTRFVIEKFNLEKEENNWILRQEYVMAGFLGVSQSHRKLFLDDWVALTQDIRNFSDDGTAPGGWGDARHDQTLLSILTYQRGLRVFPMDKTQEIPMNLGDDTHLIPFYVTWDGAYASSKTDVLIRCGHKDQYDINVQSIKFR